MSTPLPDNGIPVKQGDPSFVFQGVYHPITWYGGEPYRPRVETLVIKNNRQVYLKMYDTEKVISSERLAPYELPGGSIDNDCDKLQQAENEVNEEILAKVKNIYQTNIQYYETFSDKNVDEFAKVTPLSYRGFVSEVFVAEYAGAYDAKNVEDKDLDPEMQKGKFYAITLIADKLAEPHLKALLECPFVDENVKFSLHMAQRKQGVTIENSHIITESKKSQILSNEFKDDVTLSKWMKSNIKYKNFTKLMTVDEVYASKSGSCHDQVIFEYEMLKNMGYSPKILFFIEYKDGEETGGRTHALVYYTKPNDKNVYWFENAWGDEAGIHSYKSVKELKDDITKIHSKEPQSKQFPDLEFRSVSISKMKSGITLNDLVSSILETATESYAVIQETKRSELPDSEFGVPEERKYPLDTEEHVRSAIKLFNHVDDEYEAKLAHRILKKMKEFGITDVSVGEKNRFSKYYKSSIKESLYPVVEADDDDDTDVTDYTDEMDTTDTDVSDDDVTDYTAETGDDVDNTDTDDEPTDYTDEVDDNDTENDTSAQSEDTTTDDDTSEDSSDESPDEDDDGITTIGPDDIDDDSATDYTDETDNDTSDDSDTGTDADTSSDSTDDTGNTDENDETTQNNNIKNYNLILDFQNLYRLLGEISSNLETTVFKSPIQNISLTQIVKNMRRIKDSVSNYIEFNFGNDYVTNLYNYNIFVKALKINLEMLRTTKDLEPDNSTNN